MYYNNNYYNPYNTYNTYNSVKQSHLNYLNTAIDKAMELMEKYPDSQELFDSWTDYTTITLNSFAEYTGNYNLLNDYRDFIFGINNNWNWNPFVKYRMTISKIMDYYRYLVSLNY